MRGKLSKLVELMFWAWKALLIICLSINIAWSAEFYQHFIFHISCIYSFFLDSLVVESGNFKETSSLNKLNIGPLLCKCQPKVYVSVSRQKQQKVSLKKKH